MGWRPFPSLPGSCIRREFAYDHDTCEVTIRTVMDIEPLLELNAEMRNSDADGWSHDKSMRTIAEIPMHVLNKWAEEWGFPSAEGIEFDTKVVKRMRDRDFYKFRTSEGRA